MNYEFNKRSPITNYELRIMNYQRAIIGKISRY